MDHLERRGARHDAVVLVRVTLRLGEALPTAGGATDEVGSLRGTSIEATNQLLGAHCCLMLRAVALIEHELRVTEGPTAGVGRGGRVPHIRAGRGVVATQPGREGGIDDRAVVPTIPRALEFPVPL